MWGAFMLQSGIAPTRPQPRSAAIVAHDTGARLSRNGRARGPARGLWLGLRVLWWRAASSRPSLCSALFQHAGFFPETRRTRGAELLQAYLLFGVLDDLLFP